MSKENQRTTVREQRERLIEELNAVYTRTFDQLPCLDLADRTLARLTQLILNSRESAITTLQEEIEAPLITSPSQD